MSDDDPLEAAAGAVYRITDHKNSGTGFLVRLPEEGDQSGRLVLVTAAHVLDGLPGPECKLILRLPQTDQPMLRKETSIPIRDGNQPRWKRHPEQDIAALFLDLPEGPQPTALAYQNIADEAVAQERRVRVGREVFIACYPSQLEANELGWPVVRRGIVASHPLVPLRTFKSMLIDYRSFGGDSGAPIVLCEGERPLVVGMILGMLRQTEKTTTPSEERTLHTPLGLGIAVQSPWIRDTIDQLLRQTPPRKP
ncbi:MAG: serine protease [Planctomycetales bacterium]